jgi:hypothetical protein
VSDAWVVTMTDYQDHLYAAFGVPPETEEEREWRRQRRDRPPPRARAREQKLDTPSFTLDDVDQRIGQSIAAEHELIMGILARVLARLRDDMAALAKVPGPRDRRGRRASPGRSGRKAKRAS